jgi:FMN phosphatase YigB (HAD superfamily)
MARRFDAVLFDAGGVLVLPDPAVLGPLLAYYGAVTDPEAHARAHYAGMAAKSAAGAGESQWGDYDSAYLDFVGVAPHNRTTALEVLHRVKAVPHLWRHPIAGAVSTLRKLHELGVPTGVVSNASGQIEETLLLSAICQVGEGEHAPVRCIVDSHVVGIEKPDPRIFDHALEHFVGVERRRIAYVGDSLVMDVRGAAAAGLTPLLMDPHDDARNQNVERLRSLSDLLQMFR